MKTQNLLNLKIHKLSQDQYNNLENKDPTALYLTPDAGGNDAEVTLSEPFTLTQDFGYYKLNGANSKEFGTTGQSLHSFLQGAFAQETAGSKTNPSYNFTVTGSGTMEGEIGSSYSAPSATFTVTSVGSYTYGPATGITFSGTLNGQSFNALNATSGNNSKTVSFGSTGIYSSEANTQSCVLKYSYTAGPAALTNLGNTSGDTSKTTVPLLQISAKSETTETKSVTFTGYRKMFMGATNSTASLTSSLIRGLSGVKAQKTTKEVSASVGDKKIIWAIPTSLTTATPTFKYWFNNEWHELSGVSAATTVKVAGAGSDTGENYNVYTYSPAAGTFEAEMKTQITIN